MMFAVDAYALNIVATLHLPLVERFYADNGYRVKCGRLERVFIFTLDGKIVAAARLILQQSDTYLLRNLCVATDYRRQGIASQFLSKILPQLIPKNCYCFISATLQNFYEDVGFACLAVHELVLGKLALDKVPEDIKDMHVRQRKRKRGWILMGFIHNHSQFTSCQ